MRNIKVMLDDKEYLPYKVNIPYFRSDEAPRMEIDVVTTAGFQIKDREIKTVIFNPPATIVYWCDGTKTVVKANNEEFDPEKGLAMAISKKYLGNKGNFNNVFKKWVK